jgi:hypothetical protein
VVARRIGFVRGGNHSITAGILAGEGTVIPEHVYDMSWLFELVRTDGNHWFVDGQKAEAVKSGRSAAVFEIGRLLTEGAKMGEQITNAEWEKISPDNFETASLLRAVDAIDDLRDFSDGEYSAPPQIRTDLLRLHEIAMAVINEGSRSRVSALFELASDLDEQISHLVNRLDEVQDTLSQLMELYPESLYYDDIEGDEE